MKIAITGATGFIGHHLIHALHGFNQEILCVGRNKEKLSQIEKNYDVAILCADIEKEQGSWFSLLGKPDIIIHLAWQNLEDYKNLSHLHQHLQNHMIFLKQLVDEGIKKVVVSGTCFEYGLQSGPLEETDCPNPVTPYGAAKDTLRQYLQFLQSQKTFSLVWLRYFYMYGNGQSQKSFFSQLEHAIKQKNAIFNMSEGEQLRDYLPVEEVAKLTASLACTEISSGIYNICSGQPVSMRHLAEEKISAEKSCLTLNLGYYPYPDYESMAFWGDKTKLDQFLNNRKMK